MEEEKKDTATEVHLQIGELARRAGVSIRTVRYYEEKGLLNPSGLTSGGIRLYNQQDLNRLIFIRRLKTLGLNIEEIKMSLGIFETSPEQKVRVERTLELLRLQKEKLKEELTRLTEMAKEIENSERLVTRCLSCRAPKCPAHCPSLAHIL
ncbi:MAG: MerR family transcriptional regulator [Chloroflexi bacterium]|nr:MerR family transcriptional regulator [Chloroflexota bacterium]